jgi:glutamate-1-semialdehyde 2,1-aminomutase
MVRFTMSGTEATHLAIRIARAYTGHPKVVKLHGHFHGWADGVVAAVNPPFDVPMSAGVPTQILDQLLLCPPNDIKAVEGMLQRGDVAAVILEPAGGQSGTTPTIPGYLQELRALTERHNVVLIFDEVITGFRVGPGGAQGRIGVRPDLTCLGKVIGGGLPVGAYGGSRDLMGHVAPLGPMYQAGTLSGNPIAVAAGKSTLSVLKNSSIYDDLEERSGEFEEGVKRAAEKHGVPITVNRVGSMWTIFFTDAPVTDYESASRSNREKFARFFHLMLAEGVYLPPSQLEAAFFSAAHAKKDILQLIERTDRVLKKVAWDFEK